MHYCSSSGNSPGSPAVRHGEPILRTMARKRGLSPFRRKGAPVDSTGALFVSSCFERMGQAFRTGFMSARAMRMPRTARPAVG